MSTFVIEAGGNVYSAEIADHIVYQSTPEQQREFMTDLASYWLSNPKKNAATRAFVDGLDATVITWMKLIIKAKENSK